MKLFSFLAFAPFFFASPAWSLPFTGDALKGLKESFTINQRIKITYYSATPDGGEPCEYECTGTGKNRKCTGGKNKSPSGFKPLSATIQSPGNIRGQRAILAAVPQVGGNSYLYGCFFTLGDGRLYFAGDRYGPDSNNQFKVDISSECEYLNPKIKKLPSTTKIVAYNCPGRRGGAGKEIARDQKANVRPSEVAAAAKKSGRRLASQPSSTTQSAEDVDWIRKVFENN